MKTLALDEVLRGVQNLPSLPAVVLDLLASLDNDADLDVPALARLIEKDQSLSARTLRIANSSFYGMPRQVRNVEDAIAMLGLQTIRSIALSASMIGRFPVRSGFGAFDFVAFWRHCIETALAARALAALSGRSTALAYTGGLLHDVGRLVLAYQFPATHAAVLEHSGTHSCSLLQAERELLRFDHCTVGQALAQHWKLPPEITAAIGQHHDENPGLGDPLPLLVHVADAMAHGMQGLRAGDTLEPVVCADQWKSLGLQDGDLELVVRDVLQRQDAAFSILS